MEMGTSAKPEWVRPVSAYGHGELYLLDRRLPDGSEPAVLDVLQVRLAEPSPDGYHTENWLIASGPDQWDREGRLQWTDLATLPQLMGPLWLDPSCSSDRVSPGFAAGLSESIQLIYAPSVTTRVVTNFSGARQHRARFTHAGDEFDLVITDPWFESRFHARKVGEEAIDMGPCYLTVSLSHPYDGGYSYKLVAAIITQTRADEGD